MRANAASPGPGAGVRAGVIDARCSRFDPGSGRLNSRSPRLETPNTAPAVPSPIDQSTCRLLSSVTAAGLDIRANAHADTAPPTRKIGRVTKANGHRPTN